MKHNVSQDTANAKQREASDSVNATKLRLDVALVRLGLVVTRNKARQWIEAGCVVVNGDPVSKAKQYVELLVDDIKLKQNEGEAIAAAELRYVSRSGAKLEGAIKAFQLEFSNKVVLDIGASTGGFTQCALEAGAGLVLAVDVGTNQLHPDLLQHPKVVNLEQTDCRKLTLASLPAKPDVAVCDVAFISLTAVAPTLFKLLNEANAQWLMALLKPQFEAYPYATPQQRKRFKGLVEPETFRNKVVEQTLNQLSQQAGEWGWHLAQQTDCPLLGEAGNQEVLTLWKPEA